MRWLPTALLILAASASLATAQAATSACVPAGEWVIPGGKRVAASEVLGNAAKSSVVLLGESHDDMDHHRWQLQMLAALSASRGSLVLGFESFPRRVQGALDRWVAGDLSEAEFLAQSDWRKVWNMDAQLYLPLFHFARMNRVPMIALNVESDLVRSISRNGLQSIPEDKREGVGKAAPAAAAYLDRLFASYAAHPDKTGKGAKPGRNDPEFLRFVDAQQFWDRAMAQGIADALKRDPKALVVGIMGAEHVARGYGVMHQLAALGVTSVTSLLPWDAEADCRNLQPGLATAVFGVPDLKESASKPRLGIRIEAVADGVRVSEISAGSLAEASGLRANDVLLEAAGKPLKLPGELVAIVAGMPAGTWLPLKAKRDGQTIDLLAKFPPTKQ
jgi:uncharacterized iron-regulated protein